MRTGRIINTGARKLDGQIRSLTLRDQLQQVINLRGVNTITHPIHGVIPVSELSARSILDSDLEEGHLIRFKASEFNR
jgi:hypothetical protein